MREPQELKKEDLESIVWEIQKLLYLDSEDNGSDNDICKAIWNPDKTWKCTDILDLIADLLEFHQLVPEKRIEID